MGRDNKPEIRFDVTELVKEAVREVSDREGQTEAAFIRSCVLPFVRDEMRAIAARIEKNNSAKHTSKRCPNCGAA
jgi:hypothetical protein